VQWSCGSENASSFDAKASASEQFNRAHHDAVFFLQNARGQRLRVVVVAHQNGGLQNNGPAVHGRIDEMRGTSGDFDAVLECLSLRVESFETREQRRVDVDHATAETIQKPARTGFEYAHESREHDEISPRRFATRYDLGFRTRLQATALLAGIDRVPCNTKRLRNLNGCGLSIVGYEAGHFGRKRFVLGALDERPEVASASGG
jgi:hypothetical protein